MCLHVIFLAPFYLYIIALLCIEKIQKYITTKDDKNCLKYNILLKLKQEYTMSKKLIVYNVVV